MTKTEGLDCEYRARQICPGQRCKESYPAFSNPCIRRRSQKRNATRFSARIHLIGSIRRTLNSLHAVVTDPPYGLIEYSEAQLEKRKSGKGGVWRIPPSFDGCQRSPLPRFTVLTEAERMGLREFFYELSRRLIRVLVPGAHVLIATNPLVSHLVYEPFVKSGFEKRGEIIRLVQTLRGGDRPKNAETEFPMISVMPRSGWEPWGLFRKPCEGRVQDNLRKWKTGGLRRISAREAFKDVIESSVARSGERDRSSSLTQTAAFQAAISDGLLAIRRRYDPGSVYGLCFDYSGRGGLQVEEHRH